MGFILCCAVLAGLIQLLALSHREKLPKEVPVLSFCLMELIRWARHCFSPLSGRSAGFFGWRLGAALCLWIAGGVLTGCAAAWVMDRWRGGSSASLILLDRERTVWFINTLRSTK